MTPPAYAAIGAFCLTMAFGLVVWAGNDLWEDRQPARWRVPLAIVLSSVAIALMVLSGSDQ
jgi:hypothetical protein